MSNKISFSVVLQEYLKNSTLHGARYMVDGSYNISEKIFWIICISISWVGSVLLILASLDQFQNNAISFVVETSYRDWETNFPAIVVCENKNLDRIQEAADSLWGPDHEFALEEVLGEISYFRGESYHTIHECGGTNPSVDCMADNFSYYAKMVRSNCKNTVDLCFWNKRKFDCCEYFHPMETELGICYGINSLQTRNINGKKLNMVSNKYTGPGTLSIEVLTEAYIYIFGEDDVPNLVTSKSEILMVGPFISYNRKISVTNIENDEGIRDISVDQRNCRYNDENILDVHDYYSYSACSVQCRKDAQLKICNCTSHLIPHTDTSIHCNMSGLICLNDHYEELSVVIAKWSTGERKGVVCDCLPSCTELDVSVVHDSRDNLYESEKPISKVEISLMALPTERYKRNVVRAKLDLVGGTTGLFVGASLLSFVEIIYYFTVRPYISFYILNKKNVGSKN